MRSLRLACFLLLLVAAGPSAAQTHIRWNTCFGDGGVLNRFFACDTNTGSEQLVCSFTLTAPVDSVYQIDAFVNLAFAGSTLPAWWQFRSAGSCRTVSLNVTPAPPLGASACVDWADGSRDALLTYRPGIPLANGSQIEVMSPVTPLQPFDLVAGQEYFACSALINHQKTVGTGACAGCGLGACMGFVRVTLIRSAPIPYMAPPPGDVIVGPGSPSGQVVTWQGGAGIAVPNYGGAGFIYCPGATPARNRTWGEVKALYH